jgi:aldehyde:ferredoxin oxidoreductase
MLNLKGTQMEKNYPTLQYVVVDLTKEKWSVHTLTPSVFSSFLGGNGLGLYLYETHCAIEEDTCEQAPLIFTTGLFTQFQIIDKDSLTITARSPISSLVRSATNHTSFASHIVSCGFCAVVLIGSARRPMVLDIAAEEILFNPTEKLLNKKVSETLTLLNPSEKQSSIVIGPAGENQIPFASLISEGKSLEREGFGALLGAKRIKALVIEKGPYSFTTTYQKEIEQITNEIEKKIHSSFFYKRVESENHLQVIKHANLGGFAGIAHTTKRSDPRLNHLYGSTYPSLYSHPSHLKLGTVFIANRDGKNVLMDSNTMLAFGSNIKNFDPILSATYTHRAIEVGLDPISTAMIASWVMEGVERGVVDDIPLSYSDHTHLEEIIDSIAFLTGNGKKLAKGSLFLAKEYKNKEFVTCVHSKEMMPYDPRGSYGQALLMALGYDFLYSEDAFYSEGALTQIKGTAKSVILSEQLYILSCALGMNYDRMVALLYDITFNRFLRTKSIKKNSYMLTNLLHYILVGEFSALDLYDVARKTLELEQRINSSSRAIDATLPLQFLLSGESNYEKESTVPLTKLLNEYKVLYEIELSSIK